MSTLRTVDQQVQRISTGEWFKPKSSSLRRIAPKAKTEATTHPKVMEPQNELYFFTFPEDFDFDSIKGTNLKLEDGKTFTANGKQYSITETPTTEYEHFVPVFAASSTEKSAWLAAKPFTGAFSIAESKTADAAGLAKVEAKAAPKVTANEKKLMAASFKLGMDDPVLGLDPVVERVDPKGLKRYWNAVGSQVRGEEKKKKRTKTEKKEKKEKEGKRKHKKSKKESN